MKKFIYCALIALITISCEKNEIPGEGFLVIPKTLSAYTPEFDSQSSSSKSRALMEYLPESWDISETATTRTYAVIDPNNDSEYIQYWSAGDAISVFCTTANLQYQMSSYKDGILDVGKFDLVGDATQGKAITTGYYYSVYPYKENTSITNRGIVTYTFPETQHYNTEHGGDSYANGENGMIATISQSDWNNGDCTLYFQNFCSYLQLRLATDKEKTKTVKKIILRAKNSSDAIAGVGTVEVKDNIPVAKMKKTAVKQITLDCGSGVELSQDIDNPTKFWFVLPGGFTFTQGFSITAIFSDYSYFIQSTSKQIGIARSHIKPMATLKPETIQATGPIRYKYNSGNKEEAFPLNNTFLGVDGSVLNIIDQVYDEETNEWVVLLSGTLKAIGGNSFEGPGPNIEYIKVDNGDESVIVNNFAFYNCTADSIIINNDVESINESAFTGSTIKDLNIYGDITTVKNSAGTGSSIENLNLSGNVKTIEEQAFANCVTLKTLNIENIETIGESAFSGCSAIQTIDIKNIETIGYRAFYMCSALTQVSIPGVKTLGMGAFRNCKSLETIDLGSVVTIDDNAFMDCSSLTTVTISEDCKMIGEGAFCNATSLQTVYCYAEEPPFIKTDNQNDDEPSSYVFDKVSPNICIYIPSGSYDNYIDGNFFEENTNNWGGDGVDPTINWWFEEYYDMLEEMELTTN